MTVLPHSVQGIISRRVAESMQEQKDREGKFYLAYFGNLCPVCDKKYKSRKWLKRHMDNKGHWRYE